MNLVCTASSLQYSLPYSNQFDYGKHALVNAFSSTYVTTAWQVGGKDVHTTGAAADVLLGPAGSEVGYDLRYWRGEGLETVEEFKRTGEEIKCECAIKHGNACTLLFYQLYVF